MQRATNRLSHLDLSSAVQHKNGLGIGNFDIIRLHWDSSASDIKKKLRAINEDVKKDLRSV